MNWVISGFQLEVALSGGPIGDRGKKRGLICAENFPGNFNVAGKLIY